MKKYTIIVIFLILFSSCILVNAENKLIASGETIFVDDDEGADYTKIQDAVDNASDGDTIFVYNGRYFEENITIDKSINLIGENKHSTIIDGCKGNNTVKIISENVVLSGFTITNSSNKSWCTAGIRLTGSNNKIFGNIISNNLLGIFGKEVINISIYDNIFLNDGITFSLYDHGYRTPYEDKYFIHNIYNNTINSKKIYYYLNQDNFEVPNDAGQVFAVNCFGLKIKNLTLSNTDYPIILVNCNNSKIEESKIKNNDGTVWLIHSKNNTISRNEISKNYEGIVIDTESKFNTVSFNNIKNNIFYGIIIEDKSNYNIIYRNSFYGNNPNHLYYQAYFRGCSKNIWEKNYWNRGMILPRIIFGKINDKIVWINLDWSPALLPNPG